MNSTKTVWKQDLSLYSLDPQSRVLLYLPYDAEIVHVAGGRDPNLVTFWYEFYGHHLLGGPQQEQREIYVFGTGHEIPVGLTYRGTAHSGEFVWHLYERQRRA